MTELFQLKEFTSHAGHKLPWIIECDALSQYEWGCLAEMIMQYEKRPFRAVIGIPAGGNMLAFKLAKYCTGEARHGILIVDDVYTTGLSFKEFIAENRYDECVDLLCWVVFARIKPEEGINALFQMPV